MCFINFIFLSRKGFFLDKIKEEKNISFIESLNLPNHKRYDKISLTLYHNKVIKGDYDV